MKVLIFGAGVIGSLYGIKLKHAGFDVTLLDRGKRYEDIKEHGIVYESYNDNIRRTTRINIIKEFTPDLYYDIVIVTVKRNQLDPILPVLGDNKKVPTYLFMLNNPAGPDNISDHVGKERTVLGFPGSFGSIEGNVARYILPPSNLHPATIGELDGSRSNRIYQIGDMLKKAKFSIQFSMNMDGWLKTHAIISCAISNTLYRVDCNNYELAKRDDILLLLIKAIKEGINGLKAQNIPVALPKFKHITWIPHMVLLYVFRRLFASELAEQGLAKYAYDAQDEMAVLSEEILEILKSNSNPLDNIKELYKGYMMMEHIP